MKLIEYLLETKQIYEPKDKYEKSLFFEEILLKINNKLPSDFVDFYSFIGNSKPLLLSIIKVNGEEYSFDAFYDINQDDSISSAIECYEDRMPTWLIPFSPNYMGNEFVISIRDKDYGSVYLWEHDYEYDEDEDDCPLDEYEGNLIKIADSFSEFILSMIKQPED